MTPFNNALGCIQSNGPCAPRGCTSIYIYQNRQRHSINDNGGRRGRSHCEHDCCLWTLSGSIFSATVKKERRKKERKEMWGGGKERERETDRPTDRQTDRQRQRHWETETDRQTDRLTDRQTDRNTERQRETNRQTETEALRDRDRPTDRDTERQRLTDRQTDRNTQRQSETNRQAETDIKEATLLPHSLCSHPSDGRAYVSIRWLNSSSPFFWDADVYSDFVFVLKTFLKRRIRLC